MRYSSGGMWGIAIYFAKNAAYSHEADAPGGGKGYKFINAEG